MTEYSSPATIPVFNNVDVSNADKYFCWDCHQDLYLFEFTS